MSDLERQLEELFMSDSRSRRVDQVNVPAPRRNRFGGPVFVGGVAMAALALIVAFSLLRGGPENVPASSPSPSGSAGVVSSPGPSASAAPSASSGTGASNAPSSSATTAVRPDAQHGVITRGGSGGIVRTEAAAAALTTLKTYAALAVSRDGRRVAYVRLGETGGQQLIVFDTATPNVQKTLIDFSGIGERAGGLVWSSDGNDEVLIQVDKPSQTQPLAVDSSSLRAVNVDTGASREIVRITTALLLPIVWHAATSTGGAVETGGGGFAVSYDYISGGTLKRSPFPQGQVGAFAVRADADGRRVLALSAFGAPRGVSWWPYDTFADKRDLKPAEGWDVSAAFWRAGTDEIVVFASPTVKGAPGPTPRIEAWTTSDQHRTVAESTGPLATLRTDGTAAITTNWNVVDLTTGAITAMPPGDGTQTPEWAVKF
jgi:hypothetical protein